MSKFMLPRLPADPLARPERRQRRRDAFERNLRHLSAPIVARLLGRDRLALDFVRRVRARFAAIEGHSLVELQELIPGLRRRLLRQGFNEMAMVEGFALLSAVSRHVLGLRPHDEQLRGARLLMRGTLAEMATGEGKSLTSAIAAATAGLAGVPVHLITVNDYLAARDAKEFAPFYAALGLRVGCATAQRTDADRRDAYACHVTYCDNKILVFDYLRDQVRLGGDWGTERWLRGISSEDPSGGLFLRGLHFALVDEADSILIDEARTPLILSGPGEGDGSEAVYREALRLAENLRPALDFQILDGKSGVELTPGGEHRVAEATRSWGGLWAGQRRRQALAVQALTAHHRLMRDRDYLVRDGKVQIVDPHTGRVMPDRQWSQGLHQLVELKEGLEPSAPNRTLARISYQRFFRRYHHLCGLSGTAKEVATELWRVYGLPVVRVPTHRPVRRAVRPPRAYRDEHAKWQALARHISRLRAEGSAVLAGCDSVAASEALSGALGALQVDHRVLNARQSAEEAELVAAAGQPGQVTVTTQMAGRGTDIKVHPRVVERGGLHVLLTACQAARRIDRQLEGRCARQGDPGVVQYWLSRDDALAREWGGAWMPWLRGGHWALGLMRLLQWRAERAAARQRYWVERQDEQEEDTMAFAGRGE